MDTEEDNKTKKRSTKKKNDTSFYDNQDNMYNDYSNDTSQDNGYGDFYSDMNNNNYVEEETSEKKPSKAKYILIILLLILLVALLAYLFFTRKKNVDLPKVSLLNTEISVKEDESAYISYEILNSKDSLTVIFESMDPTIAEVNEEGNVIGKKEGNTSIKLKYNNGKKDVEETCNVIVLPKQTITPTDNPGGNGGGNGTVSQKEPSLNLTANTSGWTNNAIIKVSTNSNAGGSVSSKYVLDCSKNCSYKAVSNNTIVVNESGTHKVTVVATDSKNGKTTTKSVTVKVDTKTPTVTLINPQTKYQSKTAIEVCATCTDQESGCKEERVCKIFKTSATGQVITMSDKAGNNGNSSKFDIIVGEGTSSGTLSCSLSVAEDGTVTATYKGSPTYYGFNSSYSGTNETTKKVTSAQTVTYYVKNSSGANASCSINVKMSCSCTFKGNNGKCYKNIRGKTAATSSGECTCGECTWSASDKKCYTLANEGRNCTFKAD